MVIVVVAIAVTLVRGRSARLQLFGSCRFGFARFAASCAADVRERGFGAER